MYTGKQLNQGIKQVGFVLLLLALFFLIINELNYFFSSVLGAVTLYLLLRPWLRKLLAKGWSKTVATFFLLIITILFVFIVGGALLGTLFAKLSQFSPQMIVDNINSIHDAVLQRTGYNIFSKDIVDKAVQSISGLVPNVFSTTGSIITNSLMMIFILYFMLLESFRMEAEVEKMLPVSKENVSLLKTEVQNMVVSNAIGIPLIMIGQALVAALGYWIFGAGDPVIWGLLTGIFGLIPVVGTAGIWLPLAINLFIGGDVWSAIGLVLYGAIIISSVDNVIRIVFLKRYANVHPLVTIFGIILGMNLFGFWGIIFGPLMISGFMVLCKIYKSEFLGK